ncbi:hypothetical protein E4T80_09985 [Muribacter muris]|uniref:Lysozyme n=1 Tax=Muribacter muris TaxID=67855 RepID=A0A4Y9JV63_9PAST|nr:glycoside hydrolase family 104 protein [Muribacter muris]MBF0785789.1 glycoside hydrolase family 104 protein [Muribacter muris]MBF0828239.1 glycoside hydrolase family 104 protein [Muribacter muris]TFV08610.1 hypothetical protein E4T80_09985 [Muribacter muris]
MAKITLADLEKFYQHKNSRAYLDLLAYAEGVRHGYHTTYGNKRIDDLSQHPNKVWGRTGDGATTATGRYQFTASTWKRLQDQFGFKDFGERSQDLAALALIAEKGAMQDILNGDIAKANYKLRNIWASLPDNKSPHQSQKSYSDINRKWLQLMNDPNATNIYEMQSTPQQDRQWQSPMQDFSPDTLANSVSTASFEQPTSLSPQANAKNAIDSFTAFTDSFNQLSGTLDAFAPQAEPTLAEVPPAEKPDYSKQLASAFGIAPSTQGKIPDYFGEMIKSIYDQTA